MVLERIFGDDKTEELDTFVVHSEMQSVIGELRRQRDEIEEEEAEAEEAEDLDADEIDVPYREVTIRHPRDERVVKEALKRIKNDGAKEVKRTEVGEIEDPLTKIGDPNTILQVFEQELTSLYDELYEKLKDRQQDINSSLRHLADDEPETEDNIFAYLVAEMDNGYIIGGASDIIRNVSREKGFNDVEREFLRIVYDESIRQSDDLGDVKAHLLIDDVVIVFDESVASQQQTDLSTDLAVDEDENKDEPDNTDSVEEDEQDAETEDNEEDASDADEEELDVSPEDVTGETGETSLDDVRGTDKEETSNSTPSSDDEEGDDANTGDEEESQNRFKADSGDE